MFNTTLVLSAILILVANAGVYSSGLRKLSTVSCTIGLILALLGGIVPLGLLSLFLLGALAAHEFCARRPWRFPALSGLTALATFGIALLIAQPREARLANLRDEFRYESLEDHLPPPATAFPEVAMPTGTASRLDEWESSVTDDRWGSRSHALQRLHEERVELFARSPGFGVVRTVRAPLGKLPETLRPEELRISQPNGGSVRTHDDTTSTVRSIYDERLHGIHIAGILDFINHENFGYVKDRRHVAGFQSHRFSKVPEPSEGWRVETLDLVGLLLHKEPVAYVSANLPRMDELKKALTRPLDRFETTGLEKLRGGEDLVTADASANLRMLGAIRSAKQCVQCHGGQRGDLLGAFSYTLVGGTR